MSYSLQQSNSAIAGNRRIEIRTTGDSTSTVTTVASSAATVIAPTAKPSSRALQNAVYGHIRAIRALGRTQISASEIATVLSLPVRDVITALKALRGKGVKIAE